MTAGQSDIALQRRQTALSLPALDMSLDDLIASVAPKLLADKAKIQAAADAKAAKEKERGEIVKARRDATGRDACGLTTEQRLKLRQKVLAWEAENEWMPFAFVAFEQVDTCLSCGSITPHLVGVYQHQKLRAKHQTQRFVLWAPEQATDTKLPRQLLTVDRSVSVCPRCAWQQGFAEHYPHGELVIAEDSPQKLQATQDRLFAMKVEIETLLREARLEQQTQARLKSEIAELNSSIGKDNRCLNDAKRHIRKEEG